MHCQRATILSSPQPKADSVRTNRQRSYRTWGFRLWPLAIRDQRAMRDPHRRNAQRRSQMYGQTGPTWVIATRRIDEKNLGSLCQGSNGHLEKKTLPNCQATSAVGSARPACGNCLVGDPTGSKQGGARPPNVALFSEARPAPPKTHEDAADRDRKASRAPGIGRGGGQGILVLS